MYKPSKYGSFTLALPTKPHLLKGICYQFLAVCQLYFGEQKRGNRRSIAAELPKVGARMLGAVESFAERLWTWPIHWMVGRGLLTLFIVILYLDTSYEYFL